MDNAKLKKQVKDKFTEYLTFHNCRKTPERFAILDHIYSTKGHFDINSLYKIHDRYKFSCEQSHIIQHHRIATRLRIGSKTSIWRKCLDIRTSLW